MQPFELPDFYTPWPARLNPHLDFSRVHSKAWAFEMGILNASPSNDSLNIWNEQVFDRHDYALFCAYIHPDAPVLELNLMTDWNVWAFYVDDYFLKVYKKSNDYIGAKKYLDRVLLFMPIDFNHMPVPTNPTERGLADVWLRTAPTKSDAWRCRIIESTRSLLEASIAELVSMSQQRLANPIEYIEMRRQVGGAMWSADLVEHAVFVEIPERIALARPMQVLKDSFADAVHLRNDIFSYEREVIKDGELTNGVLVIERFMGVDTQRSVHLVNDLLTSRLQQFEHTALTELIPIFLEYGLDPVEQANVLTYIRGLQDWQSGAHEWHIQTSRYLNPHVKQTSAVNGLPTNLSGLGTSATRITSDKLGLNRFKNYMHIPYEKVGKTTLPEFYMPFTTTRMNSHLDAARHNSKVWARSMGMLDVLPDHSSIFIFDERRLDVTDLAFFCALAHPSLTKVQFDLALCWLVWATYTDDYFPLAYGHTSDMVGAKIFCARLSEFMPVETNSPTAVPITPVERGLADLWANTAKMLSLSERRFYRKIVENMVGSWLWELSGQIQNRVPDIIDYIEMRRQTSGSDFIMFFPRLLHGEGVPVEIYKTRVIKELNNTAIDYVYLTNDILSYQKEVEFQGELNNAILVIQNFMGCDQMQAVDIANNLMTARMKQFEYIVAVELPALFENFDLNIQAREQLLQQVEDLKNFMGGSLQWHIKTDRYKEIEFSRSVKLFTGNAIGLGTAAARTPRRDENTSTVMPSTIFISPQEEERSKTAKKFAVSHITLPLPRKKEEAQPD